MKIDVYNSYATSQKGHEMHFDVLVKAGTPAEKAHAYGQAWMTGIGENPQGFAQKRCNFCHSEETVGKIHDAVSRDGYYILQMEGCPQPEA